MTTLLTSCAYDPSTLQGLSNDQLQTRKANMQRIGLFMLVFLIVIAGSAFMLESYFVAATSWAMIPALMEYSKKRKALQKEWKSRSRTN